MFVFLEYYNIFRCYKIAIKFKTGMFLNCMYNKYLTALIVLIDINNKKFIM